ncbi:MAG: hypothetical protein GX549_01015 [Clostridiales bacterium]|nr:hypothetical protein [Clostridiales bacterium]
MVKKRRRPRSLRGWLRILAAPWALLVRGIVWKIRAARARRIFRRELIRAQVPPEIARRLSDRYRAPSLRNMSALGAMAARRTGSAKSATDTRA